MIRTKKRKQKMKLLALMLSSVLCFQALFFAGCEEPSDSKEEEETETLDIKERMTEDDETEATVETFMSISETEETETTEEESTETPTWEESESKGLTALAQCYTFVNVRTGPSTAYSIVGKVYNNCAATIIDEIEMEDGLWYLMSSGNCCGFIKAEYFIVGEAAEAMKETVGKTIGTVKEDYLRIRSSPDLSTDDNIVDRYRIGTEVVITEVTDDGWAKISPDDTTVGYVYASCLDIRVEFGKAVTLAEEAEEEAANAALVAAFKKAEEEYQAKLAAQKAAEQKAEQDAAEKAKLEAQSKNALRQAVVQYALQFVGNPYVHAGRSLITGTDCSGFTALVYKHFGYTLSYAPEYQWKQGTQVEMDLSKMLPGDLIFFTSTTKAIGHVGIYLGNGKLIHAANTELGVIISDAFYRQPVCVVRIIQ